MKFVDKFSGLTLRLRNSNLQAGKKRGIYKFSKQYIANLWKHLCHSYGISILKLMNFKFITP